MTILDERSNPRSAARSGRRSAAATGPRPMRPPLGPVRYRGSGVAVSAAPHGQRPVSTRVTVLLALLAGLITLWLGSLAQFGSARVGAAPEAPERLAVVVVQAGESLHHLAGRIAPDAPAAEVVERIKGLNELDSGSVDTGQTLIVPVG